MVHWKDSRVMTILVTTALILWIIQLVFLSCSIREVETSTNLKEKIASLYNLDSDLNRSSNEVPLRASRVAVLIPYFGDQLPSWFNSFAISAASTSSFFDWYIFATLPLSRETPPNVFIVQLSPDEFYSHLAQMDPTFNYLHDEGSHSLKYLFSLLLKKHSYALVEFKPCLGYIFADYIHDYSHWAFADMDVLLGNNILAGSISSASNSRASQMSNSGTTPSTEHISEQSLQKYDVITFSFGDSFRLYMRGQLTINRNTPMINTLWKQCDHLLHVGARLKSFFVDKSTASWPFQSAEGCYSSVVFQSNISVYYAPLQLSDAFQGPADQKEALLLGSSLIRCYTTPITVAGVASTMYPSSGTASSTTSSGSSNPGNIGALRNHEKVEKVSIGVNVLRSKGKAERCSYWLPPQYDVCVAAEYHVPATAEVFRTSGKLYYIQPSSDATSTTDTTSTTTGCRRGVFFHFQGWKRLLYSFNSLPPPLDATALLIAESGFIPMRLAGSPHSSTVLVGDAAKHIKEDEEASSTTTTTTTTSSSNNDQYFRFISTKPAANKRERGKSVSFPPFEEFYGAHVLTLNRVPRNVNCVLAKTLDNVNDMPHSSFSRLRGRSGYPAASSGSIFCTLQQLQQQRRPLVKAVEIVVARASKMGMSDVRRGTPDITESSYCVHFSLKSKRCQCALASDEIAIFPSTEEQFQSPEDQQRNHISLISVGWTRDFLDSESAERIEELLLTWGPNSPKILVLAWNSRPLVEEASTTKTASASVSAGVAFNQSFASIIEDVRVKIDTLRSMGGGLKHLTVIVTNTHRCTAPLVSGAGSAQYSLLPDKMLFNLAMDVAPPGLVCLSSVNFHLGRTFVQKKSNRDDDKSTAGFEKHIAERSGHEKQKQKQDDTDDHHDSSSIDSILISEFSELENFYDASLIQHQQAATQLPSFMRNRSATNSLYDDDNLFGILSGTTIRKPLALVVPSFNMRHPSDKGEAANSREPFPNEKQWKLNCGSDQPRSLIRSSEYSVELLGINKEKQQQQQQQQNRFHFRASELLQKDTLALPVIFDNTESPHGSHFVRFPEELNGRGCFEASMLRVLAGAGYGLHWSGEVSASSVIVKNNLRNSEPASSADLCGCMTDGAPDQKNGSQNYSELLQSVAQQLNNYYLRAVSLRTKGIEDIYSRKSIDEVYDSLQNKVREGSIHQ